MIQDVQGRIHVGTYVTRKLIGIDVIVGYELHWLHK